MSEITNIQMYLLGLLYDVAYCDDTYLEIRYKHYIALEDLIRRGYVRKLNPYPFGRQEYTMTEKGIRWYEKWLSDTSF